LNKLNDDKEWRWADGSALEFTYWQPESYGKQPPGDEECAAYHNQYGTFTPFSWIDIDCSLEQYYICQNEYIWEKSEDNETLVLKETPVVSRKVEPVETGMNVQTILDLAILAGLYEIVTRNVLFSNLRWKCFARKCTCLWKCCNCLLIHWWSGTPCTGPCGDPNCCFDKLCGANYNLLILARLFIFGLLQYMGYSTINSNGQQGVNYISESFESDADEADIIFTQEEIDRETEKWKD